MNSWRGFAQESIDENLLLKQVTLLTNLEKDSVLFAGEH